MTGEVSTTQQLKETTDAAVSEGQHDVAAAKSAGAGLVQQAREVADNVLGAAQVCILSDGRLC